MKSSSSAWRTLRRLGTIFLVNVAILCFLVLGFGREYLRNREIERNIRELEQQNAALEEQKLEALSVISSLSSEYYLESEARKKHSLARPGEELVIIEDGTRTTETDLARAADDDAASNPVRWFYYFFDQERFEELRSL